MKIHRLGNRTAAPAFFDMACRFRPSGAHWYGLGFRLGDRVGALVYLGDWRARNPQRKLIVLEDNFIPHCEYSKRFGAHWVFQGVADEVHSATTPHENFKRPAMENLYRETLWKSWYRIMHSKRHYYPSVMPDTVGRDFVDGLTKKLKLPSVFVTVQPLWDAAYDRFRNQSPQWWESLINILAPIIPLVVIGDVRNSDKITLPSMCYPVWNHDVDAMASLELIRRARWHIGGETGLTLWAPTLKTPTFALYREWVRRAGRIDTRPMTFGAPVVHVSLDETPEVVADFILRTYTSTQVTSTPV